MRILQVASEAVPLCKTGGLADVVSALSRALCDAGDDVRIVMPAYAGVREAAQATPWLDLGDPLGCGATSLWRGRLPDTDVPVWLVACDPLYMRGANPYLDDHGRDYPDNGLRFGLLSRVAAWLTTASGALGWPVDVVHCHDWQAGLVPAYLAWWGGAHPPTIHTVHNLHFAGRFARELLPLIGLPTAAYAVDGLEFHGSASYLKAGLFYADRLTTVSPTYALEIRTPEGGEGFDGLLRARSSVAHGVLNGIDTQLWDPQHDPLLSARYGPDTLDTKKLLKRALQQEFGLRVDDEAFLVGSIGRLTAQKGVDILLAAMDQLPASHVQLIVLGSGEQELEIAVGTSAHRSPDRIGFRRGYDESLSHRILAGIDAIVVPSRFEPCGLTQLYGQRYGTPPIVRKTGGLADTVIDDDADPRRGTGFVFGPASPQALAEAMKRALHAWRDPPRWRAIARRGMAQDLGWERGAQAYRHIYHQARALRPSLWIPGASP